MGRFQTWFIYQTIFMSYSTLNCVLVGNILRLKSANQTYILPLNFAFKIVELSFTFFNWVHKKYFSSYLAFLQINFHLGNVSIGLEINFTLQWQCQCGYSKITNDLFKHYGEFWKYFCNIILVSGLQAHTCMRLYSVHQNRYFFW